MFYNFKVKSILALFCVAAAGGLQACSTAVEEHKSAKVASVFPSELGTNFDETSPKLRPTSTLLQLALGNKSLSTLVKLVQLCDLAPALNSGLVNYTLFAPTDEAFAKLLGDSPFPERCTDALKNILYYHLVSGKIFAAELKEQQQVTPILSKIGDLFVTKSAFGVKVNTANVIAADLEATNGVVHVVNKVLLPDYLGTVLDAIEKRYVFRTLSAAIFASSDVKKTVSTIPVSFFAPTEAAFAKVKGPLPSGEALSRVLYNHVARKPVFSRDLVPGLQRISVFSDSVIRAIANEITGQVQISGETQAEFGKIVEFDIATKNGVIQVIDTVLLK